MTSIAVIGANGYVGSALSCVLEQKKDCKVVRVTRDNYADIQRHSFDILINSAMPSARFWAKNNPEKDFIETVQKTADLVYRWRFKKIVQISTVSARCQLDTVYGRHKAAAEKMCEFGNNLIIRLGPLYGHGLQKGVLIDLLENRKVYLHAESRYCFASVDFVASWISSNLSRTGMVEVGARNAIRLGEVADYLGAKVEFEGPLDHQEIQDPEPDFPDACEVFSFLDGVKKLTDKTCSENKRPN